MSRLIEKLHYIVRCDSRVTFIDNNCKTSAANTEDPIF